MGGLFFTRPPLQHTTHTGLCCGHHLCYGGAYDTQAGPLFSCRRQTATAVSHGHFPHKFFFLPLNFFPFFFEPKIPLYLGGIEHDSVELPMYGLTTTPRGQLYDSCGREINILTYPPLGVRPIIRTENQYQPLRNF